MIVEAGVPTTLDYSQRSYPLFHVLEKLCFYKLSRQKEKEASYIVALRSFTAQGYPGFGVQEDAVRILNKEAITSVRAYIKQLYPWEDVDKLNAGRESALLAEAPDLIEEWYRIFEPENLKQYQESRKSK